MTKEAKPFPKRPKRHVATREEWRELRELKVGPCRATGRRQGEVIIDLHHIVGRDLGGGDVAANLIPLEHETHLEWEDRGPRWREIAARIRDSFTEEELAYVLEVKGPVFLDRYYPRREQ